MGQPTNNFYGNEPQQPQSVPVPTPGTEPTPESANVPESVPVNPVPVSPSTPVVPPQQIPEDKPEVNIEEQSQDSASTTPSFQVGQPIRPMEPVDDNLDDSQPSAPKGNLFFLTPLLLLLFVSGSLGYLYYKEKNKNLDPTVAATEEANQVKGAVSKHALLPNEEPVVATITDIDKLKAENPEFYADAENGDKVLVYTNKAILYDPDRDVILNIAPIIEPENQEGLDQEKSSDDSSTEPAEGE